MAATNGVYWIGTNGNYYIKTATSGGVQDLGKATPDNPNIDVVNGLTRINDPNAPAPVASTPAPAGGGGSAAPALNQGAVSNTQLAIDQIPGLLQAALAAEAQNHQNSLGTFNQQEDTQRKTYDTGTVTNQQNYDANFMDSIRAGIHGLGGLLALLRGTGASGGTADQQVKDVVGGVTSNDIRTGHDTQQENQGQLDSSLATFLTDLKGKRQQNEDTFVNNNRAIQRDSNTQLQDLYGKMAGYYGDAQMTPQRDDFMSRAGSLTPAIAAATRTQVSPYDTTPVAVQAPQITAFAPPTQPDVLAAPASGQVGSGIFTIGNTKRKDPALVPAGA